MLRFYLLIACLYHAVCGAPQLVSADVIPNLRTKLESTDRSQIIERICQMQVQAVSADEVIAVCN